MVAVCFDPNSLLLQEILYELSEQVAHSVHIVNIADEKVFEGIFREHYSGLASFALKYVKDTEIAEEIVQELFSDMWIKTDLLKIKTSVKSYLFGAVRNACLNYIKHQKVEQKYADRTRYVAPVGESTDFLELEELKEKIAIAMDKIPEKCREIFELNRFEGKRYKEIADELNLSLKTVENQMGKALKIMREELGEYLPAVLLFLFLHGGKW
jgi:RNA polymerase sigma-70 factor, ECF subfamily